MLRFTFLVIEIKIGMFISANFNLQGIKIH